MKYKVVIIVSYTYPYIGSGIGNVAQKQAELLVEKGFDVTIVSSNFPKGETQFEYNGVKHLKMNAFFGLEKFSIPVPLFLFNRSAFKALKESNVIHIHDGVYPSSLLGAIIGKIYGKKIIVTQHVGLIPYKSKIIDLIQRLAYTTIARITFRLASVIIYLNPAVNKQLNISSKSTYIPNGVDSKLFSPKDKEAKTTLRSKLKLPQNKKIVLFVGRLVHKKGFNLLFESRSTKYLTLFIGGGEVPQSMRSDLNVKFIQPMPHHKLAEYFQCSDIFVLPSKGEGFPLSIQEAMSTGLPVITSSENIITKDLEELLISTDLNSKDISSKIEELLSNKQRISELSKKSREYAVKKYSWESNIQSIINLYRNDI